MPLVCQIQYRFHYEERISGLEPDLVRHVHHVVRVLHDHRPDRVVVLLFLADGEVPRDEHVRVQQAGQRGPPELILREVPTVVRHRVLLVQRRPPPATFVLGLDAQEFLDVVAVRMQRIALLAQQCVVRLRSDVVLDEVRVLVQPLIGLRDGRVLDHLELVDVLVIVARLHQRLQPPGQVIVVPPRLDDQHPASGRQTAVSGRQVPLPDLFTGVGTVGLLRVLHRVVNHETVRAFTRDRASDTRCHVPATVGLDRPGLRRLVIRIQAGLEHRLVQRIVDDALHFA